MSDARERVYCPICETWFAGESEVDCGCGWADWLTESEMRRALNALRDSEGREVVARGVVEDVHPGGAILGMLHIADGEVEVGQPFEITRRQEAESDTDRGGEGAEH